jgi:hypothetical protein
MQKIDPDQFMAVLAEMPKAKTPIAANPKTLALRYLAHAIIDREGGNVTCKDIAKEIGVTYNAVKFALTPKQRSVIKAIHAEKYNGTTVFFAPDFTEGDHHEFIASMRFDIDQEE